MGVLGVGVRGAAYGTFSLCVPGCFAPRPWCDLRVRRAVSGVVVRALQGAALNSSGGLRVPVAVCGIGLEKEV